MIQLDVPAIVLSLSAHGEHGAVVRLMTAQHGLQAAYVRGARGRRMRPVLMAGNLVAARLRSRTDVQLPQAEVELTHSRGPLLGEPLPASAIEWVAALTATALPEGQPYPPLYQALDALLAAIEAAPAASGWGAALVRYELLMLAELGFGLDLAGRVVPRFVRQGGPAGWGDIADGLELTGHFLLRDVLTDRSARLGAARARLVERLRRAGGLD
ncbi:recombination protein O N-terminal domain-containing protein [Sphingomonas sp.]|uniref:DNA repair protein RecO n=1 Tax=Sphingomonas sp. TaxID=28214 RepID=UPI00286E8612|nr:recombination protein O N-terminal domain-containing protein [Sphingomonas sp.]